jgi:hypothetical protein
MARLGVISSRREAAGDAAPSAMAQANGNVKQKVNKRSVCAETGGPRERPVEPASRSQPAKYSRGRTSARDLSSGAKNATQFLHRQWGKNGGAGKHFLNLCFGKRAVGKVLHLYGD